METITDGGTDYGVYSVRLLLSLRTKKIKKSGTRCPGMTLSNALEYGVSRTEYSHGKRGWAGGFEQQDRDLSASSIGSNHLQGRTICTGRRRLQIYRQKGEWLASQADGTELSPGTN